MKTTAEKKAIVTEYAKLIKAAWKANDPAEADRLVLERVKKTEG